ncbi:MAG: hypothetical protein ACHRXM_22650 [Isosphaerales bacterium]
MGERTGFVCPECGASNRAGETVCFLCGHGLDTLRPETRKGVPNSPTSPELVNPYKAPTTIVSPALTFRISSLLLVIAVIAVCLGVAHENWGMGILLAITVTPALLYTMIVAAKSKVRGRPMAVFKKIGTFLAAIVGVVVIAGSAVIAFFVTCIPAVAISRDMNIVAVTCYTAGVATAALMTYYLLFMRGRRSGSPGKP